ncbi:MAG: DEAD/DEAH box helicase, partial [Desulfobacterales bacterium]|nr:DEAD/DEAH box helicase [Desulfobacterales bacterium]
MPKSIDIFDIHAEIMDDYKHFVRSFIHINDEKIKSFVETELDKGKFWPEPLIQFNPSFEHGESVRSLCEEGALHPDMETIFKGYDLYRHQVEAIKKGVKGEDFVVTSGTGSGKSLTYLGTIFDHLLKNNTGKGIKAVIVYPMNALINSQYKSIENYKKGFEKETGETFPITFQQYTGALPEEKRREVKESPPDILLTNYMMLELILTRSREDAVRNSIYENVKHLVFDELHTYRGRQGSDVAILIRRIKARAANPVTCIGTSATMASEGTISDQKRKAAEAAGKIFGVSFTEDHVINEYLKHCFDHRGEPPAKEDLAAAARAGIDPDTPGEALKTFPLSLWLESKIALDRKEGLLIRRRPMRLSRIRRALSRDAGLDESVCGERLKTFLKWIANVNETMGDKRRAHLPYKIHQFISQTGAVYVSLDPGEDRIISLDTALHKGHGDDKIPLFPVVFSRISGHEFIRVKKDAERSVLRRREFREILSDDQDMASGYLITGPDAWRPETDLAHLPEAWVRVDKSGVPAPVKKYRDRLPQKIYFNRKGDFSHAGGYPYEGWFMPAKLLFDPTCGVQYDPKTSEATKLTRLGSEGRSTSTTVLTHAVLRRLEDHGFEPGDQKVLSFTDNRQDAALQAGHFNDSLKVARLRSAIYHALVKNRL